MSVFSFRHRRLSIEYCQLVALIMQDGNEGLLVGVRLDIAVDQRYPAAERALVIPLLLQVHLIAFSCFSNVFVSDHISSVW